MTKKTDLIAPLAGSDPSTEVTEEGILAWTLPYSAIKRMKARARLVKHAGPIHPGTGTDQSVHGNRGLRVVSEGHRKPSSRDTTIRNTLSHSYRAYEPERGPSLIEVRVFDRSRWWWMPDDLRPDLDPMVREVVDSIPDSIWEAADRPRLVVSPNGNAWGQHGERVMKAEGMAGPKADIFERHDQLDNLSEDLYPHTIFASLQHTEFTEFGFVEPHETIPHTAETLRRTIVHELGHVVAYEMERRGFPPEALESHMRDALWRTAEDPDNDPWWYVRHRDMNVHEFLGEAFVFIHEGKGDVVPEEVRGYLGALFPDGKVPISKSRTFSRFTGTCGTTELLSRLGLISPPEGPEPPADE